MYASRLLVAYQYQGTKDRKPLVAPKVNLPATPSQREIIANKASSPTAISKEEVQYEASKLTKTNYPIVPVVYLSSQLIVEMRESLTGSLTRENFSD